MPPAFFIALSHAQTFRRLLRCKALLLTVCFLSVFAEAFGQAAINVGSRVELFTDDYVIHQLTGDAKKVLQHPEPKEVVFTTDAKWEGNTVGYFSMFQDGDEYRMYYRGSSSFPTLAEYYASILGPDKKLKSPDKIDNPFPPEATCVALSKDGITWTRPELDIFERDGSKKNNIVWEGNGSESHNMSVFKDSNPKAAPDAPYKAIGGKGNPQTLASEDGFHWKKTGRTGVKLGTFDSQNQAFWDSAREEYRLYWRYFPPGGALGIRTATSKDFVTWENETDVNYIGRPKAEELEFTQRVHLYAACVQPYFNAPHIIVGFPTRYTHKGSLTWPLLMTSRDGVNFDRWDEEPVIPLTAPANRDTERSNTMALGMLQLPGKPDEISVYAKEAYRGYGPVRLRRFVYRLDGFVSITAGAEGGEMVTKPLIFTGKNLVVNYKVREGGSLRVEIMDENGKVLKDFALADCEPLTGDSTKAVVQWKGNSDLSGAPSDECVRFRFVMKNADLYSIKL